MNNRIINYFEQLMNIFWLRPENALLTAFRADHLFNTYNGCEDINTMMDVSCGDGLFTFISFGGELSLNTDVFQVVNAHETIRKGDYDHFDKFHNSYAVNITKQPIVQFDFGSDWKENLINKADKLDFYKKLIVHDNNTKIPLANDSFDFIYSNSSYWVTKFEYHITDLIRLIKPGGYLVLEIKTNKIMDYKSDKYIPWMGNRFHEIIDAGRLSTWKGLRSKQDLENMLLTMKNIELQEIKPIYGNLLGQIWDVGLRPIFNPLVKMANYLTIDERIKIKEEWIYIFRELFHNLLLNYETNEDDAFEFLFVLKKSNSNLLL